MHISLHPVLPADAPLLGPIESAAAVNNPAGPLMWPGLQSTNSSKSPSELAADKAAFDARATAEIVEALSDPNIIYMKAVDEETGQIVGYSYWAVEPGRTEAQWAEKYANRWRPPTCNAALMDALGGARTLKRAKILGSRTFYTLRELYVLPEYQRKGIGAMFVEVGLRKADREGLVTYIEATRFGLGLYLKYGFREVDRVEVDLEVYGGESYRGIWDRWALLLREGREVEGESKGGSESEV